MRDFAEDLILLRLTDLPFVKIDSEAVRAYLRTLDEDVVYRMEELTVTPTAARKVYNAIKIKFK